MSVLDKIKLDKKRRDELEELLLESLITNIEYIQNKVYIFMLNSKIIILKNSNLETYNLLKKFQEENQMKRQKNEKLTVTYWTEKQKEYLRTNFSRFSFEELSKELNKSIYQISLKAMELELVKKREWTDYEINYLKKNINLSNYEIAEKLKRTLHSVKAKKRIILNIDRNLNINNNLKDI